MSEIKVWVAEDGKFTTLKTSADIITINFIQTEGYSTALKMKLSIKDFSSKCDQISRKLRSHLLKKSLMENFIFCAVHYAIF